MKWVEQLRSWLGAGETVPTVWEAERLLHEARELASRKQYEHLFKRGLDTLRVGDCPDDLSLIDVVYVAQDAIATTLASIELETVDEAGNEVVDDPLTQLLAAPHPGLDGPQLIDLTAKQLDSTGSSFWVFSEFARDQATGPERPHRIDPYDGANFKAKLDSTGEFVEWLRKTNRGVWVAVDPQTVCRFNYVHPKSIWKGLAPLAAARQGYTSHWKGAEFNNQFYANGGLPPFYVWTPPDSVLAQEDRDALSEDFSDKYLGIRRAGTPPVMHGGTELRSIAVNQKDSLWLDSERVSRTMVLAIYNCPPTVAGFHEDANRADVIEQKRFFWGKTIFNRKELIQRGVNARIAPRWFPRRRLRFKFEERVAQAIPENLAEAVESIDQVWRHGVPAVEAYAMHGITLDTKDKPWLEVGFLEFGVTPAADVIAPKPDPPPPAVPPADDPDGEDDPPGDDPDDEGTQANVRRDPAILALQRSLDEERQKLERQMLGGLRSFANWLGKEVAAKITDEARSIEARQEIGGELRELGDELLPGATTYHARVIRDTRGPMVRSVRVGWGTLVDQLTLADAVVFDLLDPMVIGILDQRKQSIVGASDTLARSLRRDLGIGIEEGDSPAQLQKRTEKLLGRWRKGQARTVTQTEVGTAFNGARMASMEANGIREHEWLTARDPFVRDTHEAEDGNIVAIGDTFPSTGLKHPNDPGGPPGEVINCRCVALPIQQPEETE